MNNGYVSLDRRSQVWFHRFFVDGKKKAVRLGHISELPNRLAAERRASLGEKKTMSFREAAALYELDRMPARKSTARGYQAKLKIATEAWGPALLPSIQPIDLDNWFRSLSMSSTSKSKLKFVMGQVFSYAELLGVEITKNPLNIVRIPGASRRKKVPKVLTPAQIKMLLIAVVREPFHTLLATAACLGIRRSELAGLRWSDIDWDKGEILIQRSYVEGVADAVKTESSEKALPLAPELVQQLDSWRTQSAYKPAQGAYIFANPATGRPYDLGSAMKEAIQPVAYRIGLGTIGWHTLRHSYRAMQSQLGTPIETQKNLLRHSDIRTTLNTYGASLSEDMREANEKVAKGLIQ